MKENRTKQSPSFKPDIGLAPGDRFGNDRVGMAEIVGAFGIK